MNYNPISKSYVYTEKSIEELEKMNNKCTTLTMGSRAFILNNFDVKLVENL